MQTITTIGLDIAKSVFQVHANMSDEERARVIAEFADSLLKNKHYDLFCSPFGRCAQLRKNEVRYVIDMILTRMVEATLVFHLKAHLSR